MVRRGDPDVKPDHGKLARFRLWVDCHPRTGWYITILLLLNTLLNLLDLLHH